MLGASFTSALTAAHEAAGSQHYPQGALYVMATPIGNLADISLRALHVLTLADCIACEDTRHTQQMLRAYGIDRTGTQLLAVHQHNEAQAAAHVIERLQQGQRVAYVSDAGTPGISDPGARLSAAVSAQGLRCVPLPGASSITCLLSVAGVYSDQENGFVFRGFLPSKAQDRSQAVADIATDMRAAVLLEAPHRIQALAAALGVLGPRLVTLGRELTKQFEEVATVRAADMVDWLGADSHRTRGEFVLVVHPHAVELDHSDDVRVLKLLLTELPLKSAVRLAADITGQPRNALYEQALALKETGS